MTFLLDNQDKRQPHMLDRIFEAGGTVQQVRHDSLLVQNRNQATEIYLNHAREGLIVIYMNMFMVDLDALRALAEYIDEIEKNVAPDTYFSFVERRFRVRTASAHDFEGFRLRVKELRMLNSSQQPRSIADSIGKL